MGLSENMTNGSKKVLVDHQKFFSFERNFCLESSNHLKIYFVLQ